MKKTIKSYLAISLSLLLLLTVFCAIPVTSIAEGITYANSFTVNTPYSLTDLDGNTGTVKLDKSVAIINGCTGVDENRIIYNGFYGAEPSGALQSYTIQTADGASGASGEVVYYSEAAISDIRFDMAYSTNADFWLAYAPEFYASCDGETWEKVNTEQVLEGVILGNENFPELYSQIYDKYTFAENDDIHYVKIVSKTKNTNTFTAAVNRIYAIDYNVYTRVPAYTNSFTVNEPYSLTDLAGNANTVALNKPMGLACSGVDAGRIDSGTFVAGSSYAISDLENTTGASGEVTYYSEDIIKDVRFDTAYSLDENWLAKPMEFYASSDGVTYKKLATERTLEGVNIGYAHYPTLYSQIYDAYSFNKSDNIHYVKVVAQTNSPNVVSKATNRIYAVDYSCFTTQAVADSGYTFELDLENPIKTLDSTQAEANYKMVPASYDDGTACYHLKDTNNAFVFDGYAVYELPVNTTLADFEFKARSCNADWGIWNMEVSSDGEAWNSVNLTYVSGVNNAEPYHVVKSGEVKAADAVKYVRFRYQMNNNNSASRFLPIFYFKFNTNKADYTAPTVEDSYANSWGGYAGADNGAGSASLSSTEVPFVAEYASANAGNVKSIWSKQFTNSASDTIDFFCRSGMKNSGNVAGEYLALYFANGSDAITSYNVRAAIYSSITDTKRQIRIYGTTTAINSENATSSDVKWVELNYNTFATGYKYSTLTEINDFYGTLSAELGIKAIKVKIINTYTYNDTVGWFGINSVKFNTARDEAETLISAGSDKMSADNAEVLTWLWENDETARNSDFAKTVIAAEYANAIGKDVAMDALVPDYTTTALSVGSTQSMRYRFELGELRWAIAKSELNPTVTFGVLHVGVNATKDQMLTLVDNEDYYTEITLDGTTEYTDSAELSVTVDRTRANIGQRDTFLPYVKVTVDGETYTYYANDVAKQSPVGWMKKAVQNIGGSAIEQNYVDTIASLQSTEAYSEINLAQVMEDIAATSNQTGVLAVMESAKTGFGTQENYYTLMKALFDIVSE